MTTLYEHNLLGSKISMIRSNFNIPFLVGEGNICLYEQGITLLDENGNEKYIIGLEEFEISYDLFINTRKLKYLPKAKVSTYDIGYKCRNITRMFKRVNGSFYGKLIITIPQLGSIELLDNQSFKYRKFYNTIDDLKTGINPLKDIYKPKESFLTRLFKNRLF